MSVLLWTEDLSIGNNLAEFGEDVILLGAFLTVLLLVRGRHYQAYMFKVGQKSVSFEVLTSDDY